MSLMAINPAGINPEPTSGPAPASKNPGGESAQETPLQSSFASVLDRLAEPQGAAAGSPRPSAAGVKKSEPEDPLSSEKGEETPEEPGSQSVSASAMLVMPTLLLPLLEILARPESPAGAALEEGLIEGAIPMGAHFVEMPLAILGGDVAPSSIPGQVIPPGAQGQKGSPAESRTLGEQAAAMPDWHAVLADAGGDQPFSGNPPTGREATSAAEEGPLTEGLGYRETAPVSAEELARFIPLHDFVVGGGEGILAGPERKRGTVSIEPDTGLPAASGTEVQPEPERAYRRADAQGMPRSFQAGSATHGAAFQNNPADSAETAVPALQSALADQAHTEASRPGFPVGRSSMGPETGNAAGTPQSGQGAPAANTVAAFNNLQPQRNQTAVEIPARANSTPAPASATPSVVEFQPAALATVSEAGRPQPPAVPAGASSGQNPADSKDRAADSQSQLEALRNPENPGAASSRSHPETPAHGATALPGAPGIAAAAETGMSPGAGVAELSPELMLQMLEHGKLMRARNLDQLTLQLKPDILGKVAIKTIFENGQITTRIAVENSQVARFLQENTALLRSAFGALEIQLHRNDEAVGAAQNVSLDQNGTAQHGESTPQRGTPARRATSAPREAEPDTGEELPGVPSTNRLDVHL